MAQPLSGLLQADVGVTDIDNGSSHIALYLGRTYGPTSVALVTTIASG
jgi:hypothetical protein